MARPCKKRKVCFNLKAAYFKPRGIPLVDIEEIVLEVDEMEAVRLADFEGHHHQKAAKQMGVSRPTFSNIVRRARGKIAEALLKGNALRINCPKFLKKLEKERKGK